MRSSWPNVLTLSATFAGSPVAGAFVSPVDCDLVRRPCPLTILTVDVGGDPVAIAAEYVSESVSVGVGTARFAIASFYNSDGIPRPALWVLYAGGGVAFDLVEGTPLIKKSNAFVACSPQIVVMLTESGFVTASMTLAITTSWASVAAAIVAAGWASDHEVFFAESFANGWDVVTLAFVMDDTKDLAFSSQNAAACDPSETNTVLGVVYNNRFIGGEAKFAPFNTLFTPTLSAAYDSDYGFCVRFREWPGECVDTTLTPGSVAYHTPTAPSFFHGSAPFAALAVTRLGTHGPAHLTGLTMRGTIVAPDATPLHPKPFPEAIGDTACSDCATITITPTTPTKLGVPIAGYDEEARAVSLVDCPACVPPSGTTPAEMNAVGAYYDRRLIVNAATRAMTVNRLYRITLPDSPPATFTLTINGQTTAAIANTATDTAVQAALVALSNVGPSDVVCTGGPLPAVIDVEWTGAFDTPVAINFTGVGVLIESQMRRDDVARFRSAVAVDTNYPTGLTPIVLNHIKTTAVRTTPDSTRFVVVKPDDSEPPLLFPGGAEMEASDCVMTYRNCPYEAVAAEIDGVSYGAGVVNDVFWPNELIDGATAPIETTGTLAAPTYFRIGLASQSIQNAPNQEGGEDGLIYRSRGCDRAFGGRYLSASGDSFAQSLIYTSGSQPFTGNTFAAYLGDPGFSTSTEFDRVGEALDLCETDVGYLGYNVLSSQLGPLFYDSGPPFGSWSIMEYYPNATSATFHGLSGFVGGYLGTNNSDQANLIYKQFGNPIGALNGPNGSCEVNLALADGVKDGPFTDLEFNGYQIVSSTVSIDPCGETVTATITYRVFWIRRVQIVSTGSFPGASQPFSYSRTAFWQYGFFETREATFSAGVATDLCLRPNLAKDRTLTLAFVSDTFKARAYLQQDASGSGTVTVGTMPTPSQWVAFVAYMNSIPYVSYPGLVSPTVTVGSMPDPSTQELPSVVDFSSASVRVFMESLDGAHGISGVASNWVYELPSGFPPDWAGEHTLLADANEPHWIEEVAAAPFVKAILSPYDWTLTLFEADCSDSVATQVVPLSFGGTSVRREPRRVVARYRLPCNQRNRFRFDSGNRMELVSGDKSVANWPAFVSVRPA